MATYREMIQNACSYAGWLTDKAERFKRYIHNATHAKILLRNKERLTDWSSNLFLFSLAQELEEAGLIDETDMRLIMNALKACCPEALPIMSPGFNKRLEADPMTPYLDKIMPPQLCDLQNRRHLNPLKEYGRKHGRDHDQCAHLPEAASTTHIPVKRKPRDNYVNVHIWIISKHFLQYVRTMVSSHMENIKERQFDQFTQACNLTHQHELSKFVMTLVFETVTELDHFWQNYQTGDLHRMIKDALKPDPVQDTLMGEERVLLYIDEEEYKKCRLVLLNDLND